MSPPPPGVPPCTAAEELLYGPDEMSTMQQRRLVDARRIAQKLVVSAAMTQNAAIGPRSISVPRRRASQHLVAHHEHPGHAWL